jgi:site-specific recombinase XerD
MTAITLSALVQRFFTDRLYAQMEASPHTIASYRDTFRLMLKFAGEKTGKSPMALNVDDLDAGMIGIFLDDIEMARKNSARSRNTRLAAIRSFFRFVAMHEPAYMFHCQKILAMPSKRYIKRNVEFLNIQEMQALLNAPECSTWIGRRDHAILTIALQTGLRASELVNLRCRDVVLETGAHVRCEGKGRKHRATPLRHETITVLNNWLKERRGCDHDPLFPTTHGNKMSRDALEHLVKRHIKTASKSCSSVDRLRCPVQLCGCLSNNRLT